MADPIFAKIKDMNIRGWRFFFLWLVTLSLSTFMTSTINSKMAAYEKRKEVAMLEMKELKDLIRNQIYADEDLYVFCEENKNNKHFDTDKLEQINETRNETLRQLVNTTSSLHDQNKITPEAYQTIANLTRWNQELFLTGNKVCAQKLKMPNELAFWKKNILKNI